MYSEVQDVQRFIKWFRFREDSQPLSNQDVAHFIEEADTKINGVLRRLYEMPITDLDDMEIVKFASARFAAFTSAKILVSQAGGDIPDTIYEAKKEAEERLNDILSRAIVLENTPYKSTISGLYSHTAHSPHAPKIKWESEKEQW